MGYLNIWQRGALAAGAALLGIGIFSVREPDEIPVLAILAVVALLVAALSPRKRD